jgi:hypothetical protein
VAAVAVGILVAGEVLGVLQDLLGQVRRRRLGIILVTVDELDAVLIEM